MFFILPESVPFQLGRHKPTQTVTKRHPTDILKRHYDPRMHPSRIPATTEALNATTPMSRLNLILLPSMLVLALPGWAVADTKAAQDRPLNLSLPREVLQAPGHQRIDETVERNLRASTPPRDGANAPALPPTLPYGAGYEHRRREIGGAGAGAGGGTGAGSGGGAARKGR